MNISVVQLIKLGQKYLQLWPEKAELVRYFDDYRTVQSARFVCRYFPALALFTVLMQLYFASGLFFSQGNITQALVAQSAIEKALSALPQALVYGIFILSLPVQALIISGVKADKLLPPSLASWYRSGLEKAKKQHTQQSGERGAHYSSNNDPKLTRQSEGQNKSQNVDNNHVINKMAIYKPRYIDLAQLLQLTFASRN